MNHSKFASKFSAFACVALAGGAAVAQTPPGQPVYSLFAEDAITSPNNYLNLANQNRWSVSAGADDYGRELYERPVAQEFLFEGGRFGSKEYFEFVDIRRGAFGVDSRFMYATMELVGFDRITEDGVRSDIGLLSKYAVKFSNDPDGRFGFMLMTEQPQVKNPVNTVWGPLGVFLYTDTNGDVGGAASSGPSGLTVSKSANAQEEQGLNGYDSVLAADGRLSQLTVAWVRISPTNPNAVELALEYALVGLTRAQVESLAYLDLDALEGEANAENMHRNDRFSAEEAGSPNLGIGGTSEFGTGGLQSVYGIDNLRLIGAGAPPQCVGDWNRDGSVDGDDVIAFFAAWDRGNADVNGDGGTDGDDVIAFFAAWDTGC